MVSLLQALEKADTEGVVPYYAVLICYVMYAIPMVVVFALRRCNQALCRQQQRRQRRCHQRWRRPR